MKRLLFLPAAIVLLTACPHVEPEPEPEPAPPSAADSVVVSLDGVARVQASELLGKTLSDAVETAADGTYQLSGAGDAVDFVFDVLENYDGGLQFRRYCNYPVSYDFQLGNRPETPAGASGEIDLSGILPEGIDLDYRSKGITINASNLPEGMVALEDVTLSERSRVDVTLSIPDCFFTEGTFTPSFSVDMRQFFTAPDAVDGILNFDAPLSSENGWSTTKTFHLDGVVFDPARYDAGSRRLTMDARIGLSGHVALDGLKTTAAMLSSAPSEMRLNVTVVFYDLACTTYTGRFACTTATDAVSIPFKTLTGRDVPPLDLSTFRIKLDAEGAVPLPVYAKAEVTTRKNRIPIAQAGDMAIHMAASTDGGNMNASGSFDASSSEDLADLMDQIPDELLFSLSAMTDSTVVGTLAIGDAPGLSMAPKIEIPVAFGSSFSGEYRDTLEVPAALKGALKKGSVMLQGTVSNTLPLDAEVTVSLLDENGRALTGGASVSLGAGATMPIAQEIRCVSGADPERLVRVVVVSRLTGTEKPQVLKQNEALAADLEFRIPRN